MSPLYGLMHRWAATPFVWGQLDCALALADWHKVVHGADPAAHLRGTYFDAMSCQRTCGWFSRPVDVIENCLATVGGLPRVTTPSRGDVAVIQWPVQGRLAPVGAIWMGSAWGLKGCEEDCGGRGATTISPRATEALAIWGMGYAEA